MTANETATAQEKLDAIQCVARLQALKVWSEVKPSMVLSEDKHIPLEALKVYNRGKTGALFNASL